MFNFEAKQAESTENDVGELLELASRLSPISELSDANKLTICKSATVVSVNPSTKLTGDKEHRWFTYLLEGQVETSNARDKDETESISANSDRALQPVLREFSSHHMIKTSTTAQLVRFGRELFDILLHEQQKSATKVTDVRVTELDNVIFDEIVESFSSRSINLVCDPTISRKVTVLLQSGSVGIPELSRALASDPALTASTLYEANKSAGPGETTQTMRGAITRLGVESASKLAQTITTNDEQSWKAASPLLEEHMTYYQRRAALTGAICQVFAKSLRHMSAERAHLIGLMADIGELVVLSHANQHADRFTDAQSLQNSVKNLREVVGMWLLSTWGFNDQFIEAIESSRDFYRNHTGEITYADLVTAALLTIENELPEGTTKSIPSVVNLLLPRKLQQAGIDLQDPKSILKQAMVELKAQRSLLA